MEEIYLIAIINQIKVHPFKKHIVAILLNYYYFVLVQIFSVTGLLKEYLLVVFYYIKQKVTKAFQYLMILISIESKRNNNTKTYFICAYRFVSSLFRQLHNYS